MQTLWTGKALRVLLVAIAVGLVANVATYWVVPAIKGASFYGLSAVGTSTTGSSIVPLSYGTVTDSVHGVGPWAIYGVISVSDPDSGEANCVGVGYVEFGKNGTVYHEISRHAWEVSSPDSP